MEKELPTTKLEAVDISIELWEHLITGRWLENRSYAWAKADCLKSLGYPQMAANCPLCEAKDNGAFKNCRDCPLTLASAGKMCSEYGSPYQKFTASFHADSFAGHILAAEGVLTALKAARKLIATPKFYPLPKTELEALEHSIALWEILAAGGTVDQKWETVTKWYGKHIRAACPLCEWVDTVGGKCDSCPLKKVLGRRCVEQGTPYKQWTDARTGSVAETIAAKKLLVALKEAKHRLTEVKTPPPMLFTRQNITDQCTIELRPSKWVTGQYITVSFKGERIALGGKQGVHLTDDAKSRGYNLTYPDRAVVSFNITRAVALEGRAE